MSALSETVFIDNTRLWVERVVIGLKLCPFAPAPALKNLIRYVVSEAVTREALLEDLIAELQQARHRLRRSRRRCSFIRMCCVTFMTTTIF
jgi:hypothetical protein